MKKLNKSMRQQRKPIVKAKQETQSTIISETTEQAEFLDDEE